MHYGTSISKQYSSNCSSLDNNLIDIYFVLKDGETQQCVMPSIKIKNDCFSYQPEIQINTVTVGGALYFNNANNTYIFNSQFINNKAVDKGGAIDVNTDSSINDFYVVDTSFNNNQANSGGGLYIKQAINVTLQNCNFTENQSEENGAGANFFSNRYINLKNISCVSNNVNNQGGCIYSLQDEYLDIQEITCKFNSANLGSCHYMEQFTKIQINNLQASEETATEGSVYIYKGKGQILMKKLFFDQNNYESGGSIIIKNCEQNVELYNSVFQNLVSDIDAGGMYCDQIQDILIENCNFTSCSSQTNGGAMYILNAKNIGINNTIFEQCYSEYGGGAQFMNSVQLNFNNVKFLDNVGNSLGGAMYIENIETFQQLGDTVYSGNQCLYSGGAIFMSKITNDVLFYKLVFDNNQGESGKYNQKVYYYQKMLKKTKFLIHINKQGGAIYNYHFANLTILYCNFTNNAGEYGGIFYLKNQLPNHRMIIENNIVSGNSADFSGGIMYYENSAQDKQVIQAQHNYYNLNTAAYGLYYTDGLSTFQIQYEKFYSNKLQDYGIYQINTNELINVTDSHFEDNSADNGAVFYINSNNEFYMHRNTFINNQGTYGGVIHSDSLQNYIENNNFQASQAQKANSGHSACIYAVGQGVNSNFIVENSVFKNNIANTLSTVIYLENIYNVEIYDLDIDSNQNNGITVSSLKGGSIYISFNYLSGLIADPNFIIKNINIHGNHGDSSGGIYIEGAKNCFGCLIYNVQYQNNFSNKANDLQNIFMIFHSNYIKIDDIKFLQIAESHAITIQNSGDIIVSNLQVQEYESTYNSIIKIQASQNITLLDSQFYNIISKYKPVMYLQNSKDLFLDNLIFNNCINQEGDAGGIYGALLENLQISLIQLKHIQGSLGSCIYIEQSNYIEIKDSQFTESTAVLSSPGLFLEDGKHFNLQNCLINNNVAKSEIGGVTINKITNITFAHSQITDNDGGQEVGGITVDNSEDVKFNNLTINNNFSAKQAGGLRFQYTLNTYIYDTHINNNQIFSNKGGGIIIIYGEGIYFDYSEIIQNEAYYGAGIYIQQSNNITLNNTEIMKNTAKFSGGAIYITDTKDTYLNQLKIQNNQGLSESGGGIYIDQISEYVEIQNSLIEKNYANNKGGGIHVGYLTKLLLNKVEIIFNEVTNQGAGVYFQQVGKAQIQKTNFQNNFGPIYGGALYSFETQDITIQESNFINNQANIQGGAIHVSEQQKLTIDNTVLIGNQIKMNERSKTLIDDQKKSFGGSIYADQVIEFTFKNSNIKDSYSYFKGGGIYASNIDNIFLQDSQIKLATVEAHIEYDIEKKNQEYLLSKGGGFYYEFNLEEDEIDSTDVKIKLKNMEFQECIASSGGGMLIKQNKNQDFEYSIQNLKFTKNQADIGACARFLGIFSTNFIEKVKSTTKESNNKGYLDKNALYFGFFRNERVQSDQDSEFSLCYQGQFLKEGGTISCDPCLENGVCQGGYQQIYPKKQYWRDNDDSLDFYYCSSNPDACLGHQCENQYDGVLCEDCDLSQNTFKEGVFCVQCDNNNSVVLNQILKMFILMALTLSSVMSLKKKLDQNLIKKILKIFQIVIMRENQFSIIMKIFITHNQILSAGSELAEKIPEKILNYMNFVGNPVDSVSKSLECLFSYEKESDQYEILYKGQILGYALSIISLLILISIPIFGFLFKILSKYQLKPLIISTMLCFFINVQPGALQISLKSLYCRNIGGTLYSAFQSKVLCDSEFFMLKLMPLHISMIFILVVIIPLIILMKIHKYYCQGTLYHKMRILRSYGLFYIELSENKYYWEFVWMYMKVLVVVIANFYPSQGTDQIIKKLSEYNSLHASKKTIQGRETKFIDLMKQIKYANLFQQNINTNQDLTQSDQKPVQTSSKSQEQLKNSKQSLFLKEKILSLKKSKKSQNKLFDLQPSKQQQQSLQNSIINDIESSRNLITTQAIQLKNNDINKTYETINSKILQNNLDNENLQFNQISQNKNPISYSNDQKQQNEHITQNQKQFKENSSGKQFSLQNITQNQADDQIRSTIQNIDDSNYIQNQNQQKSIKNISQNQDSYIYQNKKEVKNENFFNI
ncbi:Pectin lyase fold/virulence factor [Pseudocohnilembus persalinus]|uniref:Pectin lyase fold/virulence factor n=1 Tax=Pseudocohnilembus persalinus TaxID=266149 RepID=A0A0V0R8P1_PSEPJ|nr:Pectin lyase fold/virulence factor [Pseudocohnilembus persalinus]|eukprot:KRX10870.1 Pectin lyase fold/virulence factor [Pseudocohnilembus persalinus]